MENLLDIDYLRSLELTPKWFGLGFIQLKLDKQRRMHFWHPDLKPDDPTFEEEYHDHRYNFRSDVLVGNIVNHTIEIEPTADKTQYSLFEVCCSGGGMEFLHPVRLNSPSWFNTVAGESYQLHRNVFHRVAVSKCVTLQTRDEAVKDKARVVQVKGKPSGNPFVSQIDTDLLWGYIADLLPKKATAPGYHLVDIAKGELGELSKIREELSELEDATAQGSRVMQLVEASDMLGAITAWLERHHPGYTLDDLKSFSGITRRAFENGHR